MIMRAVIRPCVLGLALTAAGCSTLESIQVKFEDAPFTVKPVGAMAKAPAFRVGDIFRFRVGDTLIAETVERINDQGVWWRDSLGRRWVGGGGALIPTRAVLKSDGASKIVNSEMEATGDLFPLTTGKTVAYRYTQIDGTGAARPHERSCTVGPFGAVKTAAGAFDAYRLECLYDGVVRQNYYALALGRVVLQTANTFFNSVKRELVGFERGPAAALRMAKGETAMALAPPSKPAALGAADGYGVQLAAYRTRARAKRAWLRLQADRRRVA